MLTTKKDSHGNRLPKPQIIFEYTKNMSGVDLSNQYMAFHMSMRKSMKWWRKLFFHIMNMILLNAYILNTKFGKTKLSHEEYMDYIAKYLIYKHQRLYMSTYQMCSSKYSKCAASRKALHAQNSQRPKAQISPKSHL